MTYQEKYSELYLKYEKAGKILESSIQNLSEINGFGDKQEITDYFKAHKSFTFSESQFQQLLKYVREGNVSPETEFVTKDYMYEFIKSDLIAKGVEWEDFDLYPGQSDDNKGYICEIGLTNDGEIEKDYQREIYKLPVLNLNHGKECYGYLSSKLQFNPKQEFDVNDLDFSKVINENNPIFVKVKIRTK